MTFDEAGTVREGNLTLAAMLGMTRDKLIGRKFTQFITRGTQDTFYLHRRDALAEDKKQTCELALRGPNGAPLFARIETIAILDATGARHCRSVIVDITEHKRTGKNLREKEAQLELVTGTTSVALTQCNRDRRYIFINRAYAQMLQRPPEEILGRTIVEILGDESYAKVLRHIERVLRGETVEFEAEIPFKGIGFRALRVTYQPHRDDVGHVVGWVGSITDITQRRRLEAQVLDISEQERLRVAADLHDGVCQELVGLQFLADGLRRDLENVHHPLASQAGQIEKVIITTTKHTREMARGMNPVVADGAGLMHALRRLAGTAAHMHRIVCLFQCPAPILVQDPAVANQFYRIAQEAMHNALHHGRPKRITVRLARIGDGICLAVTDDGCGLPADVSQKPGMGLRVMRYRAGLIGGHLVVQPRRRGGTEVICRLTKPPPPP